MFDLAVLGLLRKRPRHGYELKARLTELGFLRVSFGSLYPALRRLEKREFIEPLRQSGRRKAYRLTKTADNRHSIISGPSGSITQYRSRPDAAYLCALRNKSAARSLDRISTARWGTPGKPALIGRRIEDHQIRNELVIPRFPSPGQRRGHPQWQDCFDDGREIERDALMPVGSATGLTT